MEEEANAAFQAFSGDALTLYVSSLLPAWELASGEDSDQAIPASLCPVQQPPAHTLTTQPPYLRYKTELCSRYTESGTCSYDDRCQFAHGLHELRVPSQHPKYKTELCRSFHSLGFCPYGLRCLFIHSPDERRPPRPIRPPHPGVRRRAGLCRMFQSQGGCPYGDRCHFTHADEDDRPRKTMCRTFKALGVCPYGSRCHFLHKMGTENHPELPSPLLSSLHCRVGQSQPPDGSLSPISDEVSSSLGTPELSAGGTSPLLHEFSANNAFAFSSLLLPLALRLQGLHCSREPGSPAWDESAFGVHRGDLSVKH
ncbi:mRNA decay activator protein ZFP36L2-like [Ambystoma mexicanum]|uniref:mRNA decay activator protein ZFP36L2-like n=1 Tax=Ambystoma mexicanum TaxID=8296 RepID=UPI0037E85ABC